MPQWTCHKLASIVSMLMNNATKRVTVDLRGEIDGTNKVFTINTEMVADLFLFKNGLLLTQGVDYTISGNSIMFSDNNTPDMGDILFARISMPLLTPGDL